MKKLCVVVIMMFVVGCAGVKAPSAPVTVCDEFAGPSLIEKYIPDLRAANTLLKLSVYEVSKLKAVQKKDIVKVLDEIEAMASSTTTYDQLFVYVTSKIKFVRDNMGAEIMIAGDYLTNFQGIATPISPKDICYIKYQINDDRTKVLPWIPAK
jgi:hypothetical protein